jgi:hypothetical protein
MPPIVGHRVTNCQPATSASGTSDNRVGFKPCVNIGLGIEVRGFGAVYPPRPLFRTPSESELQPCAVSDKSAIPGTDRNLLAESPFDERRGRDVDQVTVPIAERTTHTLNGKNGCNPHILQG